MSSSTMVGPRTPSFCRICAAHCGILVDVDESGHAVRVVGDAANPVSAGFTCVKGRQLPALANHPERILQALRREADGSETTLATDDALDEIADRLRDIIAEHGPRSVALYSGNGVLGHSAGNYLGRRFLRAIGSPMWFSSGTIDQPGKEIAHSLHGHWGAGMTGLEDAGAWLFVGVNPVVSLWAGMGISNPIISLKAARAAGTRLLVIDPRRTETAALADHHLQPRPGTDAVLLAGAIRHLFATDAIDRDFCERNVTNVEVLRAAVEPFTPDVVARRCGIDPQGVAIVADAFSSSARAGATAGTGPNMAGDGTLTEYLLLALVSLTGSWPEAGDPVPNEGVLMPQREWVAAPRPVHPAWDWGEEIRGRKLPRTVMGMPTAAAPDDILSDAPDRVRALIVIGGNPVAAWPDQHKVVAAMEALELLVCVEVGRTATTRFADYVLPGTHQLEVPEATVLMEEAGSGTALGRHWPHTYGMYSPAVVEPPRGSDVVDEAHVFFRLAQRMGLQLKVRGGSLDMTSEPSIDWILDQMTSGSRVSLDTVRRYEHGYADVSASARVIAPDGDDGVRLDVGHPMMLERLADVAARADAPANFTMISRRMLDVLNSLGQNVPYLRRKHTYNPAYMHPDDLADLGLADGSIAVLDSGAGQLRVVVQSDPTLRRGLVSCAHAWGDAPGHDDDTRAVGSNTNRLVDNTDVFDPVSGIPLMSGIAVTVRPEADAHAR